MTTEVKKKDNSLLYLVSTIAFIIVGIILTGIINTNKSSSTDIRSRASATSGIDATAIVSEVKNDTVLVDQLTFTSSPQKNMGSWIITPPTSAKLETFTDGTKIKIIIDPTTLKIETHTLTAKEIKK